LAKITKIIKGVLPKDLGALGNLKESKKVVPAERRDFLKRAGGTVAQSLMPRGVLTNLVEKGLTEVPKKVLPKNIFDVSSFKKLMDEEIILLALKGRYGEDVQELAEKGDYESVLFGVDEDVIVPGIKKAYEFFRYGGKRKPNELVISMMEEYPDADKQQLADLIGESNQAGDTYWKQTQDLKSKNPKIKKIAETQIKGIIDWDLIPNMNEPERFNELTDNQKKYIYTWAGQVYNTLVKGGKDAKQQEEWILDNMDKLIETGKTNFGKKVK
jgi:hypothetical protein|tara:strand:- start:684 stop:1496 length:813 start_codon:yes stop_codon:yes gene_type:complete